MALEVKVFLKLISNSSTKNKRNPHLINVFKPEENLPQGTLKFF